MADRQDINFALVFTIGVTSILLLVVIVVGAQAWYAYEAQNEFARKWSGPPVIRELTTLPDLKAGQLANLGKYDWTDREKQLVTIPIEQAMAHVLQNPQVLTAPTP
jgi:hypothetical protein